MGGNAREWTTESSSDTINFCVGRGGDFGDSASDVPAALRAKYSTTYARSDVSFRLAIFM